MKRVAVTGGAGQIAYSILFRIASGELFGKNEPLALHILEVEEALPSLQGVVMELNDCAFPLLKEIRIGSNPYEVFEGIEYAFLIGAKPRGPGMERKDLLLDNAKIFIEQGKALEGVADPNATILVVGNPCNTNCLIARSFAKRVDPNRYFAMTRLDQNRAHTFLAQKAHVSVEQVKRVSIWGNHSATQVPDFLHASILGKPAVEVLQDHRDWLEKEFIALVQKRGAEVIAARGKSSAASAANAALDAMKSLLFPTAAGDWFSMALCSDKNPYGVAPGLIFSFPCIHKNGGIEIVPDLLLDPFLQEKIKISERELLEEKQMIEQWLKR